MLFRRSLAQKVGIFRNQAAFEAVFPLTGWPTAAIEQKSMFWLAGYTGLPLMPHFFARAGKSDFLSPSPFGGGFPEVIRFCKTIDFHPCA
jgi:hypothetical protein